MSKPKQDKEIGKGDIVTLKFNRKKNLPPSDILAWLGRDKYVVEEDSQEIELQSVKGFSFSKRYAAKIFKNH